MPDTPANQRAFPQPGGQKAGLGFPVARIVTILSLACGAVLDLALGPCRGKQTGETALLRELHDALEPGDILLTDRYFCSYWELALLGQRGVDAVMRLHQRRRVDFRRGAAAGFSSVVATSSTRVRKPGRCTHSRVSRTTKLSGSAWYVASSIHPGRPGFSQATAWSSGPSRRPRRKSTRRRWCRRMTASTPRCPSRASSQYEQK